MSNVFELNATPRLNTGKADARRMRLNQDSIPAVVYGAGKEPQALVLSHKEINHALKNDAFYSHILDLKIDNQVEKVVLKAVQRHMFKPKIMHVDFMRIKAKEKLTMNVQISFINEEDAPGVKEGGIVSKLMKEVEIRCLPTDLPESIEVDMATLELDQSLHASDIKLPDNVELTMELDDEHNPPVVSIHKPKAEVVEEEVEEAAEGEAKAEGEAADTESEDSKE